MTVWTKIDVRNTVPTRMPVTASMTVVPDTRDVTFHVCGGTSGFAALFSRSVNATASTTDVANATRTRAESQPYCSVAPRP